jgi:methyl-accepting chemotaxis protein
MSPYFRNSRTAVKFGSLALVFLLSFSLYGLYCINTVTEVKINGPYYQRIVQSKDVIADILPPPEYLVEAYLTSFQMLHSQDAVELQALATKAAKLKADYLERHAYWEGALPEGPLKQGLVRTSFLPAKRMLEFIEGELIPELRAGELAKGEATLKTRIQPAYQEHRDAIDAVVELAKKRNQEDESRAAVAVDSRTYGQIALGLFLFFLLSIFSSYVVQQIEAAGLPEDDRPGIGKGGRASFPASGTKASGKDAAPSGKPEPKAPWEPPDRMRA